MRKQLLHIILVILYLLPCTSYNQERQLHLVDSLIEVKEVELAFDAIQKLDTANLDTAERARFYMLYAKNLTLDNKDDLSLQYYLKARTVYRDLDSLKLEAEINLEIVQILIASEFFALDYQPYLDEYIAYAEKNNKPELLTKAYLLIGLRFMNSEPQKSMVFFKKAQVENQKTRDTLMKAKIHHCVGVIFAEHTQYLDSALHHYNIALTGYKALNQIDNISYIYNNRASVFEKQGNYPKAIENYLKSDSLPIKEFYTNNKLTLYGSLANVYEKNKDYKNAAKYLKLHLAYKDSLNEEDQNTAMLDIQTKYEVEKKENENLKLKQNRTWLIVGLSVLALLLLLSYSAYKNQVSKKKIAQADKEIQQQKVEKLLKDQELNGIDAMIEGQEKERQRIANDLHDNLGSLLATLKLHFQNFKIRKDRLRKDEEALLEKTDDLIEEAYQKVRSMAHAKNAGVKSTEGLLPAIKNFAAKASVINELVIEVEDHGMNERFENTLEITLFRIIQELITNVIKHAEATESTIHLTHHEDNLNIMVEDNGIGFNTSKLKTKQGMGLYSIQKRVENLGGEVKIDFTKNNGTVVIIDIPLT